jgi:outer membrane protein insertion porin family
MKNKLRFLIATLFFFFTTQSISSPVEKVNFIGLNNTSEDSLLKVISFQSGQEFNDNISNLMIESLFKTGLFEDISISQSQDNLNITLKENPTIKYIDFELDSGSGFSNWLKGEKILFTNEILDEELVNNASFCWKPLYTKKLDEFILFLESKYSESGYYNSIITPNVSIDSQNRAGIEITIDQGERVKIDTFSISGAEKIRRRVIVKAIQNW